MANVKSILLFLIVCPVAFSVIPPIGQCVKDAYPPSKERQIPKFTIDLDLPPVKRWTKLAYEKRHEINETLILIRKFAGAFFDGKLVKFVDTFLPFLPLPEPFKSEIASIAKASGLPYGEVILYNIFYEVFSFCTSIVAQDTKGNLYHARNLDFGLFLGWDVKNHTWLVTEALRHVLVELQFYKQKQLVYKSVGFAGYVGVITAVKPKEFSLTVDERFKLNGGYIGKKYLDNMKCSFVIKNPIPAGIFYRRFQTNKLVQHYMGQFHVMLDQFICLKSAVKYSRWYWVFYDETALHVIQVFFAFNKASLEISYQIGIIQWILGDHSSQWMGFLTRSVMENSKNYTSAKKMLSTAKLVAPVYFILGGTKPDEACVITRDRGTNKADIMEMGNGSSGWYVIETNYDHWLKPPFFDDRRTPAIKCLKEMTQKNASFAGLFNVLSTQPNLNKLTAYTALMEAKSGSLETYLQFCDDPCWPW